MVRPSHQKVALAPRGRRFRSVEEAQAVHVFQSERQTAFRSENLESVAIPPSDSKTARFEAANAAVREARHHLHRVIHCAAGYKRVLTRRQLRDFAVSAQLSV